jgi:anti-sigma factor RsiW
MHRHVREQLEEVLAESRGTSRTGAVSGAGDAAQKHLAECRECSGEVNAMRQQAAALREWRAPETVEAEPRPGFYARVLERIEAQGPASIWSLFFDSPLGQRLAIASLALAALLCVCLISAERFSAETPAVAQDDRPFAPDLRGQVVVGEDQPGVVLTGAPDQDSVLVNLVTYREQ